MAKKSKYAATNFRNDLLKKDPKQNPYLASTGNAKKWTLFRKDFLELQDNLMNKKLKKDRMNIMDLRRICQVFQRAFPGTPIAKAWSFDPAAASMMNGKLAKDPRGARSAKDLREQTMDKVLKKGKETLSRKRRDWLRALEPFHFYSMNKSRICSVIAAVQNESLRFDIGERFDIDTSLDAKKFSIGTFARRNNLLLGNGIKVEELGAHYTKPSDDWNEQGEDDADDADDADDE